MAIKAKPKVVIRREDQLIPVSAEGEATPEEMELNDFLDNLGPEGISEVHLYQILPTGKKLFVTSGSPAQFSELAVQTTYGAGDYIARAKLNGKWFRSKNFSVAAPPGVLAAGVNN